MPHQLKTSKSDEQRSPDDEIRRLVLEEFRRRGYPSLGGLSVAVHEGHVSLSGRLPTYYLRQVAQAAALSVSGVDRVEFGLGSSSNTDEPKPPSNGHLATQQGERP